MGDSFFPARCAGIQLEEDVYGQFPFPAESAARIRDPERGAGALRAPRRRRLD